MKQTSSTSSLPASQLQAQKDEVIRAIDEKPFGLYHLKTMAITGIGFFTEAYDLFVIGIAVTLIGYVYYPDPNTTLLPGSPAANGASLKPNKVANLDASMMKGAALFGTLIGQLVFGYLGDKLGRKKVYGLELTLIIGATFGSALAASAVRGISVVGVLILWRVIVGIGIGGDYPLSAVMTSEFASKKYRGAMVNAVFALQGFGQLVGGLVSLMFLGIFKDAIHRDQFNADYVWRFLIGVGIIPGCVALYFRFHFPETPRYTMDVKGQVGEAAAHMADLDVVDVQTTQQITATAEEKPGSWADFKNHFSQWKNLQVLLGCSLSWFFLDVAFYGTSLNQSQIVTAIGFVSPADPKDLYGSMWTSAVGATVITLCGTVPGYWFSVALIEKWGRKPIQIMGFVWLTVLFVIMAAAYPQLRAYSGGGNPLVALYVLALFFMQFGPNCTTFIIPGEVFPTRFRSTAHGICAASGKLGAIVAQYACYNLTSPTDSDLQNVFGGFAACMFLGLLSTYWVPETKGLSLEELAGEEPSITASTKTLTDTENELVPVNQNTITSNGTLTRQYSAENTSPEGTEPQTVTIRLGTETY